MCIHLFAGGGTYVWGNIANYMVSYFHYDIDGKMGDPNATLKNAIVIFPFQVLILNFGAI